MKSQVLNSSIGSRSGWSYPTLTAEQEREILAQLFEQLMLFDKVIISTNRLNFGLFFLIKNLGLKIVEELIDKDYIGFILWTPVLVHGGGMKLVDGSIDESVIYSQPPIVSGVLSDKDIDPENNVNIALSNFPAIKREERRILIKKIIKKYAIPDGMTFSKESADLVIDSYKKGLLNNLGLPFEKEPNLLNIEERGKMLSIGTSLVETSILSNFNLKSYRNFENFNIIKQSVERIGKAYKISENAESVFKYDHVLDLKELFLQEKLNFESVFQLRHTGNAKYFRKWINGVGERVDSKEITIQYLDEIKGKKNYFANEDKFMLTIASIAAGVGLSAIDGLKGIIAGAGLTIFENYILDNLLKGKNPAMFVEDIKLKIH